MRKKGILCQVSWVYWMILCFGFGVCFVYVYRGWFFGCISLERLCVIYFLFSCCTGKVC